MKQIISYVRLFKIRVIASHKTKSIKTLDKILLDTWNYLGDGDIFKSLLFEV